MPSWLLRRFSVSRRLSPSQASGRVVRRLSCRSSLRRSTRPPTGWGQRLEFVLHQVQLAQPRQAADRLRQFGKLVVVEAQLDEVCQVAKLWGQSCQAIVGGVEVDQVVQARQGSRQLLEPVVAEIQEPEARQRAQRIRQLDKLVVAQVEHLQVDQAADARRQLCQQVVRQVQRVQALQLPQRFRQAGEQVVVEAERLRGWRARRSTPAATAAGCCPGQAPAGAAALPTAGRAVLWVAYSLVSAQTESATNQGWAMSGHYGMLQQANVPGTGDRKWSLEVPGTCRGDIPRHYYF